MPTEQYIKEKFRQIKRSPRWIRTTLGILLVFGGLFGVLPVVGFWMLPLGLILLSVDFPWAKRAAAYIRLKFGRLRGRFRGQAADN